MSVRLFVGNLSYDVSEADLRGLFAEVGSVTQVRIPLDRETGRPRGFAFVDMAEKAEADEAIRRLHQQVFQGRQLAISEAVAREDAGRGAPRPPMNRGPAPRMGEGGGGSGGPAPAAPARTFGPDALPRNKRRPEGRGGAEKGGPKGPIKEIASGRSHAGLNDDETDADDVPFWAANDGKDTEEE